MLAHRPVNKCLILVQRIHLSLRRSDPVEQFSNRSVRLQWMMQGRLALDHIFVLPPDLCPLQIAPGLQISHDALHRPLGDAYSQSHPPEWHFRLRLQVEKDMRMICEKIPRWFFGTHRMCF